MAREPKQKGFLEKNLPLIVIAIVALVVVTVYFSKSQHSGTGTAAVADSPTRSAAMGDPSDSPMAPDFTLTSTDGKTIKLSDYRGKVVVIDFFATWCPPCKAEIPDYITLYSKYKKDGFQMLGVSVD